MMITVTIAGMSRRIDEVDSYWINQQINGRHADGRSVCVLVEIDEPPTARMTLATPRCAPSAGGGRRPNAAERELFDQWHHHRLDTAEFTGGNLVAFLRQLQRIL